MLSNVKEYSNFMWPYIVESGSAGGKLTAVLLTSVESMAKTIAPLFLIREGFKNSVSEEEFLPEFTVYSTLLLAAAYAVTLLSPVIRKCLLSSLRSSVQLNMTKDMLRASYNVDFDEHLSSPTGNFAKNLSTIFAKSGESVYGFFHEFLPSFFDLIAITVGFSLLDVATGLIGLAVSVINILCAVYNARVSSETNKEKMTQSYVLYGNLLSAASRYEIAHQCNRLNDEIEKAGQHLMAYKAVEDKTEYQVGWNKVRSNVAVAICVGSIAVLIMRKYKQGDLAFKDLASSFYFLFLLTGILDCLGGAIGKLVVSSMEASRLVDFVNSMKHSVEAGCSKDALDFSADTPPRIEFKNVSFSNASDPNKFILKDVNFIIEPGQHVAIVGTSGAGKSTLMKLLQGFHGLTEGSILINGIDLSDFRKESWRSEVSVVSQKPDLYHASILENILYGDKTASQSDVETILGYIGLGAWLGSSSVSSQGVGSLFSKESHSVSLKGSASVTESAPPSESHIKTRGIYDNVGNAGSKLSGGEQQRVAVARAMLKNGLLLILDEATSALDLATERDILSRIEGMTSESSVITVTHRLANVLNADHIICLDRGQVVQQGDFTSLMNEGGFFRDQLAVEAHKLNLDVNTIRQNASVLMDESYKKEMTNFCHMRRKQRKEQENNHLQVTVDGESIENDLTRSLIGGGS